MCCPPDMAGEVWPYINRFLQYAVDHTGGWTLDALRRVVVDGQALLWIITDGRDIFGAVVTQLLTDHKGEKICELVACGGRDLNSWRHLMPDIEKFAKDEGCQKVRLSGRKGWSRVFPDFSEAYVTLEKRI